MRFMILVRANPDSEAGKLPSEDMLATMAAYHEEMARAGVLVDGNGLHPSAKGFRISTKGGRQVVTDGPFTESKELIAGYTIINVASRAEALDWARRMPCPHLAEGEIEVRQMYELEEFGDSAVLDRFREMGMGVGKKG
jgi:hypothetical protein